MRKNAVFTIDLNALDVLQTHNEDVGRVIYDMARIAARNQHSPSFQESFSHAVKNSGPDCSGRIIDPELVAALKVVHVYESKTQGYGLSVRNQTTAELPAGHAMFIIGCEDMKLAALAARRDVGRMFKTALEGVEEDGIIHGMYNLNGAKTLAEAFVVQSRDGDKFHTSILSGPVLLNKGDTPMFALIENGGVGNFSYNPIEREGVTPQLP